jgi:uncharacterized membrane protein YkvA (DUF1232 family)
LSFWLSRTEPLRAIASQLRLAVRLVRDPAVPWLAKAVPLFAAAYIVSPLDFVPDVLPLVGQVDDIGLLLLALGLFMRLCPAAVIEHHRAAIASGQRYYPTSPGGEAIDAEFRREN